MAFGLNRVELIGRLGPDVTVNHLASGGRVANLSVATDESYLNKQTRERVDKTEWHRIVTFQDGLITMFEKHARKGRLVYIDGKLQTRRWGCQRRLKIRPRGGAKDCHLGWWAELGVRLGFGDAFRGFFGGSGQRSHAELKRSAPAGRPQGGMVCRVGVSLATRALEARCRPGPIGGAPEFSYRRCFCGRGSG